MKKLLLSLTSITLVAGITAGVILSKPKETSTVNAQSFEEVAMTAPKALEVPELDEVPIVTTTNLQAPTESLNEVVEPITYSLSIGREYFIETYPGVDVYYYDNYFVDRPWQVQPLIENGDAFVDNMYNTLLRLRDNQRPDLGSN